MGSMAHSKVVSLEWGQSLKDLGASSQPEAIKPWEMKESIVLGDWASLTTRVNQLLEKTPKYFYIIWKWWWWVWSVFTIQVSARHYSKNLVYVNSFKCSPNLIGYLLSLSLLVIREVKWQSQDLNAGSLILEPSDNSFVTSLNETWTPLYDLELEVAAGGKNPNPIMINTEFPTNW